jgi:uncharacterized membrane protein (GlpM family)
MTAMYLFSFLIGGLVTLAITYFEFSGHPLLSRLAALFPVFTWLSYFFIGRFSKEEAVTSHALFVLLGTLACWVPYMLTLYLLTPRIGSLWAIIVGIALFLFLATIFITFYKV